MVVMDPRPAPPRLLTYIFFRTSGCRYDRSGECTMCNYGTAERQSSDQIIANVRSALAQHDDYDALGITPLGNMFDTMEVPAAARCAIIDLASEREGTIFSCESRPETLTASAINDTIARLRGKRFYLNLGLEAAHPWVQANCVGKSLEATAFDGATALLRSVGARPVANVLLGAPFLNQREAIDSAVGSVKWALSHGSHLCVLFPANVKGWTLIEWLSDRDMFTMPSLWSLVDVLVRLGPDLAASVVLSWYAMAPGESRRRFRQSDPLRASPTTCLACETKVTAGLDRFNQDGDFAMVTELSRTNCGCREQWANGLRQADPRPLITRVTDAYDVIGTELLGATRWAVHRPRALAQLQQGYDGHVHPS